jgi:hypothetical protein|nr:MAG TPA: hypothetical protein [Caudoviricetes sp.]
MKIIAEFNSTKEVQDFINAFGGNPLKNINIDNLVAPTNIGKISKPVKEEVKQEVPAVKAEEIGQVNELTEVKEAEGIKEVKVTKEQVREVFSKLIKAGKQKEAKELTSKYGASKVGEIKEEDYASILKDAEGLL